MAHNSQIPQRALNHLSLVQALKAWRLKRPELFVKRVNDKPGLVSDIDHQHES